jgi:hypothetical protein
MIPCLIPFSEFPLGQLIRRHGVLYEGLGNTKAHGSKFQVQIS